MKQYLVELVEVKDFESRVEFLRGLVDLVRPEKGNDTALAEERIREFSSFLDDEAIGHAFSQLICSIIEEADFTDFFIESGIPSESRFFAEIMTRIRHKLLPPLRQEDSLHYAFHKVFYKSSDHIWIGAVSNEVWKELFSKIHIGFDPLHDKLFHQITNALKVLSTRIAFYGTDAEVTRRVGKDTALQSGFLEQNKELVQFIELLQQGKYDQEGLRHAIVMLNQCSESLEQIKKKSTQNGTSLHQSFLLRLLAELIQRVKILADFMDNATELDKDTFVVFFKQAVVFEKTDNDVIGFISNSVSVLSYQIAEHKGRTGEHYITTTWRDYLEFFWASCKGGFIVSFMVVLKILISQADLPPFWEELGHSLNYAIGFVIIQLIGGALATKQPAMTASAIASTMDTKKEGGTSFFQLAVIVAKVCRSQTISFAGNLLLVFPFALLWSVLFAKTTGRPLVNNGQAMEMLHEMQPFMSLSFVFAAITGFFLFVSSVVAGYVDNKVLYSSIGIRLHNKLSSVAGDENSRRSRIISYLEKNAGTLIGNVFLGFLLGTVGLIGHIFAFPYAIRHITFSTGNLAIALYQMNFSLKLSYVFFCIAGIIGIGTFNFLASFSFAFYVGVKSRNIDIKQYFRFSVTLFRYWRKRPLHFVMPPTKEPEESILEPKLHVYSVK
ncbi:MAG TPA: hypothetical protein VNZ86_02535 [Bacteroidia bacterium]|jgi:site-specific recombinase|nr:hypothetical protein [Bacteroidia bacterium]